MNHDTSRPDLEAAPADEHADLDADQKRLTEAKGSRFWKSLEELAEKDSFPAFLEKKFPRQAAEYEVSGLSRRRILELSAATMALGSLAGCTRQPMERVVPYVKKPEEIIPGKPLFYATAITLGGYARGLFAESHEGRPTKLEGNPSHPASLGATDAITQAAILDLYDPDRSQVVTKFGSIQTWKGFNDELGAALRAQQPLGGAGVRLLTETITSPTIAAQIRDFLAAYPKAKWHQWDPAGRDVTRAGSMLAFRKYAETRYDFTRAEVILSLDSDFMIEGPAAVRHAKDWSKRRKPREHHMELSRLYVVETALTLAGASSDHRLAVNPATLSAIALSIAYEAGVPGVAKPSTLTPAQQKFASAVAKDLKRHEGRCVVVAGEYTSPELHALTHAINTALKNVGTTVTYTDPVEPSPVDQMAQLADLVHDLRSGKVDTLIVASSNPVFTAPANLDFKGAMQKARLRVHLGLHADETAEYCQWHVPEAHFLEAWGDARAFDGTISVIQPLIEPLYSEAKSVTQLLSALLEKPNESSHDLVKNHWQKQHPADFEIWWRRTLHDGVMVDTALAPVAALLDPAGVKKAIDTLAADKADGQLTVMFRPDPSIHDGRYANNGWLQELPKPLTKLTWDNALLVSYRRGMAMGLDEDDLRAGGAVVAVTANGKTIEAPVWVLPGLADDVAVIHFGHGRKRAGAVGNGTGFDAYPFRVSGRLWSASATIAKTAHHLPLFSTQTTHHMEGRALVRTGSLATFKKDPEFAEKMAEAPAKTDRLYPGFEYNGYAWGMTVDLSACIGCNACVAACQAENNIPIVGKEEVGRGRAMHWMRIDRYWEGEGEGDVHAAHHQPVMCQHCEQAPCEVVCPVGATVHSSEGLNDMVYNRCVGTKYCSNNCPYKVRRFNFFRYSDTDTPVLKLMRNPDVTVRTRGVMEKCTYCIQRINAKRIDAEKEDRPIRDGEIVTACQQACPTDTIVFGNINDPKAQVAGLKKEPHNYALIGEINTQPRTSYLAKIRNPNPELED